MADNDSFVEDDILTDNSTGENEVEAESESLPAVYVFAAAGVSLALAFIALLAFLGVVCPVCCACCCGRKKHHDAPARRYGYYHLSALFCTLAVVYFVIRALTLTALAVDALNVIPEVDFGEIMDSAGDLVDDLLAAYLGTSLLILAAMTLDRSCTSCLRPSAGTKCMRILFVIVALTIGVSTFVAVVILRRGGHGRFYEPQFLRELLPEAHIGLNSRDVDIVATCVQLCAYALLPSLVLVPVGAANWVTDGASGRPLSAARKAASALDHRACSAGALVLLLYLLRSLLALSMRLEDEWNFTLTLIVESLWLAGDVVFVLIPVVVACAVGSVCCN